MTPWEIDGDSLLGQQTLKIDMLQHIRSQRLTTFPLNKSFPFIMYDENSFLIESSTAHGTKLARQSQNQFLPTSL